MSNRFPLCDNQLIGNLVWKIIRVRRRPVVDRIWKAEIFIYRLRSLYKNTSRQVIKSSEYKPYRFFEKRTIRIKSGRPYCEMSRWHWVTILILNRLANCLIDYNDKNLIIYWVALGDIAQYRGQAMKSERWILSKKLHIGEELYPMVRGLQNLPNNTAGS